MWGTAPEMNTDPERHKSLKALLLIIRMNGTLFDIVLTAIDGKETTLGPYKGKKLLIVNTASECGFTPQYEQLEYLHRQHGDKVQVLGFPSNDFGAQEPGTDAEIAQFCTKNFGVTFPLFSKIPVKGDAAHPLYKWLKEKTGQEPNWNFAKYLVSEDGTEVKFLGPAVDPVGEELISQL
jgi:glutathione peroxidase